MAVVLGRKGGSSGGGGGPPSGAAGGDLSGTYPNPALSVAKQAELDGKVPKSLYDANTVLAANADDTPAAITMGASTFLARLAAGNIKAASVAEVLTLLDTPTNSQAVLKTLYDANTILAADSDNTPAPVTMAASTIVARLAAGNIKAASVAEIITLLQAYTVGGTDVAVADGGTGSSTAAGALTNLGAAAALITENVQTGSYGLLLADAGLRVVMNVAGANNLTVPLNATQAFPTGTTIEVFQLGAGQTTIVATGGVTLQSPSSKLKLTGQYSSATLAKRATDTWSVAGDLAA